MVTVSILVRVTVGLGLALLHSCLQKTFLLKAVRNDLPPSPGLSCLMCVGLFAFLLTPSRRKNQPPAFDCTTTPSRQRGTLCPGEGIPSSSSAKAFPPAPRSLTRAFNLPFICRYWVVDRFWNRCETVGDTVRFCFGTGLVQNRGQSSTLYIRYRTRRMGSAFPQVHTSSFLFFFSGFSFFSYCRSIVAPMNMDCVLCYSFHLVSFMHVFDGSIRKDHQAPSARHGHTTTLVENGQGKQLWIYGGEGNGSKWIITSTMIHVPSKLAQPFCGCIRLWHFESAFFNN